MVLWEIQTRGEFLFLGGLFLPRKTFSNGFFLSFISGQVPYAALGGQEIVRKLRRGERLPKPDGCSDEMYVFFIKTRISFVFLAIFARGKVIKIFIFIFFIFSYDIMLTCWKANPKERPSFEELVHLTESLLSAEAVSKPMILDKCYL